MTSIALTRPDAGTVEQLELTASLRQQLRRFAAWRRFRNYPTMRRARREAMFAWSGDIVRHAAPRH